MNPLKKNVKITKSKTRDTCHVKFPRNIQNSSDYNSKRMTHSCSCSKAKGQDCKGEGPEEAPDISQHQGVNFSKIQEIYNSNKKYVVSTRCAHSHFSDICHIDIYMKQDFFQYTGSVKDRSACHLMQMLVPKQKSDGIVIASSSGRTGVAMAYMAKEFDVDLTVVVPTAISLEVKDMLEGLGAVVVLAGNTSDEIEEKAKSIAKEKKISYIDTFNNKGVIAAEGSMAIEALCQQKCFDAVVVPARTGQTLAGVAVVFKKLSPETKIIAVDSEKCPMFASALKAGAPVNVDVSKSLVGGLCPSRISDVAFKVAKDLVDKVVTVREDYVAIAVLKLAELEKTAVDPLSAWPLAAVISGQLKEFKKKKVLLILPGAVINTSIFKRCLDRGLAAEGRLVKINAKLSDRPGIVTEFLHFISSVCGGNVKDITHERPFVLEDVFSVKVKAVIETRDYNHSLDMLKCAQDKYGNVELVDFPKDYDPTPLF